MWQYYINRAKEAHLTCAVCGEVYFGPEPERCCDGTDCGCRGEPISPAVCSLECAKKHDDNEENITMTTKLTPELQKQIEQEAEHYANVQWSERAKHIDHRDSDKWDKSKEDYGVGAEIYALKWQEAEQRAERYEKALNKIINQSYAVGYTGAKWGDSEYDSISAVTGYNEALDNVKSIANEAFTPKQTTDGSM